MERVTPIKRAVTFTPHWVNLPSSMSFSASVDRGDIQQFQRLGIVSGDPEHHQRRDQPKLRQHQHFLGFRRQLLYALHPEQQQQFRTSCPVRQFFARRLERQLHIHAGQQRSRQPGRERQLRKRESNDNNPPWRHVSVLRIQHQRLRRQPHPVAQRIHVLKSKHRHVHTDWLDRHRRSSPKRIYIHNRKLRGRADRRHLERKR